MWKKTYSKTPLPELMLLPETKFALEKISLWDKIRLADKNNDLLRSAEYEKYRSQYSYARVVFIWFGLFMVSATVMAPQYVDLIRTVAPGPSAFIILINIFLWTTIAGFSLSYLVTLFFYYKSVKAQVEQLNEYLK